MVLGADVSLVPLQRVEAIRQRALAPRVVLLDFELCPNCTRAVTLAVAGVRKQLRPCASCRGALKVRCQADRRGP